ncbi:MAG TPA: arsenite methyltransferase [Candidatus Eisenbacteria bacterium]|nr:arsenite methyltransferase [Candidatus Eisenbacteria bacterium]
MTDQLAPGHVPSTDLDVVHDQVRARYAEAARAASTASTLGEAARGSEAIASCCGPGDASGACCSGDVAGFGPELYALTDRAGLPDAALLASLGCGNPIAVAELHEGETVLDLGSGGGIDVLLSARRVGPTGRAIGLDMTDEMLALARRNVAEAGATNVEFVKGTIEAMPIPGDTVDVVISNCVINLATDKPAVFAEIARVLRPGGRVGVSDIVADDLLTPAQRAERGSYAGCIAGALSFREYRDGLRSAGLTDIEIQPTHSVAEGMYSAIVRARKPAVA